MLARSPAADPCVKSLCSEFNQGRHKPRGDDAVHCQFDLNGFGLKLQQFNQWIGREQCAVTCNQFCETAFAGLAFHWCFASFADHENLDGALCRKEVRTLTQALTLRYDKVMFILHPTELAKKLACKKVVVCDYPDGRLEIMHEGVALPYRVFDELRSVHRSAIVENKRLDAALEMVAEMQVGRDLQRSRRGPRRTGQTDHMFGIPDGAESNGYVKRGRKPGRPPGYRREQAPTEAPVPEVGRASVEVDLRLTESDENRIADVVTMLSEYRIPLRSTPANEASP